MQAARTGLIVFWNFSKQYGSVVRWHSYKHQAAPPLCLGCRAERSRIKIVCKNGRIKSLRTRSGRPSDGKAACGDPDKNFHPAL